MPAVIVPGTREWGKAFPAMTGRHKPGFLAARCAHCEWRPNFAKDLRVCKACHGAHYCGPACQRAHWAEHRRACSDSGVAVAVAAAVAPAS